MCSKVVFLGAGASVDAGYPFCKDILSFLKPTKFDSTNYNDDWENYNNYMKNNPGLESKTVEYIFTELVEKALKNPYQEKVLTSLAKMIEFRFGYKNHIYESLAKDNNLEYLTNLLHQVNTVITVNWDNLCEFILSEKKLWDPTSGYGVDIKLAKRVPGKDKGGRRKNNLTTTTIEPKKSDVMILKLHGSIGWRRRKDGEFYLRTHDFLRYLPTDDFSHAKDFNEPEPLGDDFASSKEILIFPSSKKSINDQTLKTIWEKAKFALSNASEIDIVGYSFPETDIEIIKLFEILRNRVADNDLHIKCIVGSDDDNVTSNRFQEYFGNSVEIIKLTAKEYYRERERKGVKS